MVNTFLQPSSPIKCPTKNDTINTIDNNQKVGKCGRTIKEGSKIPISTCTTVGYIIVKPETQFQQMHQLLPECWLSKFFPNEIGEKIKLLESDKQNLFRQYRGNLISEMIKLKSNSFVMTTNTVYWITLTILFEMKKKLFVLSVLKRMGKQWLSILIVILIWQSVNQPRSIHSNRIKTS